MPKGNWGHRGHKRHRESEWVFPRLEATPDINRGEQRLAGEVLVAMVRNQTIPAKVVSRAIEIASVMARG